MQRGLNKRLIVGKTLGKMSAGEPKKRGLFGEKHSLKKIIKNILTKREHSGKIGKLS